MLVAWRASVVVILVCGVVQAGAIYALPDAPLGPVLRGEAASGTVILDQNTLALTLNLTYQLRSRFALSAGLSSGGATVLSVSGLPLLSAFNFPTTIVVDNGLIAALTGEPVFITLTTTAGDLSGGGPLILSGRQGGGPPPPPFDSVPEPATSVLVVAGIAVLAGMRLIGRARTAGDEVTK